MADATIVKDLPALMWRGLLAPPYDVLPFKWKNRLSPRQYYSVDVDAHDPTGRDSIPMTARLYFVNTLVQQFAGLGRLFPDYWEQWRDQLMDGDAGDLQHPALGTLRARVDQVSGIVETKVQSGIIVEISWVETNEDPSTLTALGNIPADPATLAALADANAAAFNIFPAPNVLPVMFETTFGLTFPNGFSQPSLVDIFDSIFSSVFGAALGVLDVLSTFMGIVADMITALIALDDVMTWPAIQACRSFWMALRTMRNNLAKVARKTGQVVLGKDTTLDVFARLYGNSVAEIMALNAAALRGPYAPRGTTLSYYISN